MNRSWMPLHIVDYLADTGHLSTVEHGAYLLLIMHYWREGGLPEDDEAVRRAAKCTIQQWMAYRPVLAAFFYDGWKHRRIDQELEKAADIVSKRSASARQMHKNRKHANAQQVQSIRSDARVPTLNHKVEASKEEAPTLPPSSPQTSSSEKSPPQKTSDVNGFRAELKTILDDERIEALVQVRRNKRGALTPYAARLLKAKIATCGIPPPQAADTMILRSWISIEQNWLQNRANAPPIAKPANTVMDAYEKIARKRGWITDEPDRLQGNNHDAQRLPSKPGDQQGTPVVEPGKGHWQRQ